MNPPRSAYGGLAGRAGPGRPALRQASKAHRAFDVRAQPPQGGAASGPAEPDPQRPLGSTGFSRRRWRCGAMDD